MHVYQAFAHYVVHLGAFVKAGHRILEYHLYLLGHLLIKLAAYFAAYALALEGDFAGGYRIDADYGAALTNIEITEANIGAFKPCAKKYGVDFTLRKDKTTQPPHYIVIFKAKDTDNLEQAFREFTAKTLSKEQRPSIRKVLTAAKQKAAQQPKRAKEKIKQRELER